jgi:hypothetical protein
MAHDGGTADVLLETVPFLNLLGKYFNVFVCYRVVVVAGAVVARGVGAASCRGRRGRRRGIQLNSFVLSVQKLFVKNNFNS